MTEYYLAENAVVLINEFMHTMVTKQEPISFSSLRFYHSGQLILCEISEATTRFYFIYFFFH